ncbi:MAG: response regulator [Myxococcota bacterium]
MSVDIAAETRDRNPSPSVLVVDDEALIRWSLSEALSESGFVVYEARSASEARAALASFGPDPLVVVLDLRLPDVRDLSLLRELRGARPDLDVVLLTAHETPEIRAEAATLGVHRIVRKPFDVTDLTSIVKAAWLGGAA